MNTITQKEFNKLVSAIKAGSNYFPGLKAIPAKELCECIREHQNPQGLCKAMLKRAGLELELPSYL
jgi:hypothetical protein